jgi:hypothetical protein
VKLVNIQFISYPKIDEKSAGKASGQTDEVYKESTFIPFEVSEDEDEIMLYHRE